MDKSYPCIFIKLFNILQLIFRKVADVRREKELAERRKNEPQLDQTQDHLVRKIFSKFRRDRAAAQQQTAALPPPPSPSSVTDIEKGEGGSGTEDKSGPSVRITKLSSVAEREDGNSSATAVASSSSKAHRPTTIRASKWGRLLGSSSIDSGSDTPTTTANNGGNSSTTTTAIVSRTLSTREQNKNGLASSSSSGGNGGSGNKVFPKLQKLSLTHHMPPSISRQDTVEEIVEIEDRFGSARNSLRKVESYDSGMVRSVDQRLNEQVQSSQVAPIAAAAASLLPATEYKELVANIMDFKVDVKLEVQRLHQKVGRMEEMLSELVSRLSPVITEAAATAMTETADVTQVSLQPKPSTIPIPTSASSSSSSSGGGGTNPSAGSGNGLVLRKRRSKSRNKGAAPGVPLSSPRTSPTETTRMLPPANEEQEGSSEEKRPYRRTREFL